MRRTADPAAGPATIQHAARAVLTTADAADKAAASRAMAAAWRTGKLRSDGHVAVPDRPARPARPELRHPRDMPKRRRTSGVAGRVALLHAIAHIELNAIDLSWDMVARFGGPATPDRPTPGFPDGFIDDWVRVGDDEARHFTLLSGRLADLGAAYGDLPAHDGLWQASMDTAGDAAARLAVVPMVLEARGLDVTPGMIADLRQHGDDASADILQVIHDDEITHVAAGRRWFDWLCAQNGRDPEATWQHLVRSYFTGVLRRPFNVTSRDLAGLPVSFYEPLAVD